VDGIREITGDAREGRGRLTIELVAGANRMKAFQDIDQAVARIRTFPDEVEKPEVNLRSRQVEVLRVGLFGPVDVWTLRQLAERTRDQLLSHPFITQVELSRVPDYVTHVEIPRDRLREYGLTLDRVARIIETSSNDIAAGSVQTSAGEILLRVKARKQWAEQFAGIKLISSETGTPLTLGDVATIRDGFTEGNFHSQFNQQPSVELQIYRVGDQSPLDIADGVDEVMQAAEASFPPGVQWRIDNNNAEDFRSRLALVLENGGLAIAIVLLVLALFLELKLAFWVMTGMAISFVGGILFLPSVDVSVNMISLFGFLMVLGIVVDDAVVVGENVFEKRQQGMEPVQAAIEGTKEVGAPVIFSILTNVVAFIPLLFIPGETGQFWRPLPIVVIVVLLLSLFEALFILPAHLAHVRVMDRKTGLRARLHGLQQAFTRFFNHTVQRFYGPFLEFTLRARYITAAAALALLMIVVSYSTSAHMGLILMPEVSANEIEAGVRLPVGTTPDQAAAVAKAVTAATVKLFDEKNFDEVAEGVMTNVRGGSFIDVELVMLPPDQRELSAREVIQIWRDSIGDIPGVDQITFEAERGPGGHRRDISVDLSHSDIDQLEKASRAFAAEAAEFAYTRDVNDSFNRGKIQYDFELLPEGRALGLTPADIGAQLRGAFYGSLALRLLRGTNEIEVRVKLPEEERKDVYSLEQLVIRTPSGAEVPLSDVATVRQTEAFARIERRDGRRVVSVSMDVEPDRATGQVITAINEDVLPRLARDYPGLTWTFEGGNAEMREAMSALWGWFGLAMFIVYALLAVAFRRYVQPLIVMIAIPFGIIGAVLGHMLLGFDLSLISFMGVIALAGVVVNDSLIMVDFANRKRASEPDCDAHDAIVAAGMRRFRPILLTTVTTFLGLVPVILETSLQSQYIVPMAISLGFGILFATIVTLVLVPSLYMVIEDCSGLLRRRSPEAACQGHEPSGQLRAR
jgi:multidrug efflux pump subunit AcrB